MSKQNGKVQHETPIPADIAALQELVIESNQLLNLLQALALRPALPMPTEFDARSETNWKMNNPDLRRTIYEETPLEKFVASWFDKLDAAYACGNQPTRIVLAALAALIGPRAVADRGVGRFAGLVRDPRGVFLRKFEMKLLDVERQLSTLAVAAQSGDDVPATMILSPTEFSDLSKMPLPSVSKQRKKLGRLTVEKALKTRQLYDGRRRRRSPVDEAGIARILEAGRSRDNGRQ